MMKMKKLLNCLLSISLVMVFLAGMMIVPVMAEVPEDSITVSYPTPGSRGTNVTKIDNFGNWTISINNTTSQKGGYIPLVGTNNKCEGFNSTTAKYVATTFGVRGDNAGAFADINLTTASNDISGTSIADLKGKDTRFLDVAAIVEVASKKVYVWNVANSKVRQEITLDAAVSILNLGFREKYYSGGVYDKDIIIKDYTQTVFTSEHTTLDDVIDYISPEKYVTYPSPEKRSGSTTVNKGDKIGDWIFGNDDVNAQKAAFIPLVGTGKASTGFDAKNTKYVVTTFNVNGSNSTAFNEIKLKVNNTANDVDGTSVTNLAGKPTTNLDVMTVVDVAGKKVYVWNLTTGEVFEHTADANIQSLTFIFRDNSSSNAIDININNLVQTVYTTSSNINFGGVVNEHAAAFVLKRDSEIVIVNNNNGTYDLKYKGGTLATPKSQTSFYLKQNPASILENGVVKDTIKYVKTDFVISSNYAIGSFTSNNNGSANSDSFHRFSNSAKISLVWDVKNEKYYTYINGIFSGLNMNLERTTAESDYKYGIKLNFSKVDGQDIIGGAEDITLATISDMKQTVYGADATLGTMGLHTNTASYADGKYTINCNQFSGSIKNETTNLNLNDATGAGATIFYVGYKNNEIAFIAPNAEYNNTVVESDVVDYIKAFVWRTSDIMPLMPAEGLVKTN